MRFCLRLHVFGGLLALVCLSGCGKPESPAVVADQPDASAPSKAMEMYDTNKDGFLDEKELEQVPGLKAALKQVDTDHDGKVSQQEIASRIKSWAEAQIARMPVHCKVTHNGKALAGVTVTFVPEPFLGGGMQKGTGTTSSAGVANIVSPYAADPAIRGMSPGFYRVEITKSGEKIPAKYNTQTTLGAEVASDSPGREGGYPFDLKY